MLVHSFTNCMPLLMAASTIGLGRRRWSSPQKCYLHCLYTCHSSQKDANYHMRYRIVKWLVGSIMTTSLQAYTAKLPGKSWQVLAVTDKPMQWHRAADKNGWSVCKLSADCRRYCRQTYQWWSSLSRLSIHLRLAKLTTCCIDQRALVKK